MTTSFNDYSAAAAALAQGKVLGPIRIVATEETIMSYLAPHERGPGPFDNQELKVWELGKDPVPLSKR